MDKKFSLIEVKDTSSINKFLGFPKELYKEEKNWIRPLDKDIENVFNPKVNKLFRNGKAIRWILAASDGKIAGRIAAFYDEKTANKDVQPTGGIGFFDCIDDQEAANTLFDAAKAWLKNKNMEAMDGPINFGTRDYFWGCLSEGFTEPIYNMPYNFSYYNQLFTNYGFQNYFNQYTYYSHIINNDIDPVLRRNAENLFLNPDFHFENLNIRKIDKYSQDFVTIFNKAWARFPGVKAMRLDQAIKLFQKMKPIIDPRLIIFGYYRNEPISFFVMIPDLYQIIKNFDGKFTLLNKIKLMYYLKIRRICTRVIGLIFGVIPEFHGKGVAAGLVIHFENESKKAGFNYEDLEMNWIGDFNPSMIKLLEHIGGKVKKTHITYRYLFDRDKPFERAKIIS